MILCARAMKGRSSRQGVSVVESKKDGGRVRKRQSGEHQIYIACGSFGMGDTGKKPWRKCLRLESLGMTVNHRLESSSFFHDSFTESTFIDNLLCIRHCSRNEGYISEFLSSYSWYILGWEEI